MWVAGVRLHQYWARATILRDGAAIIGVWDVHVDRGLRLCSAWIARLWIGGVWRHAVRMVAYMR